MADSLVKEFYTNQVHQEWRRLVKNAYHRLEFETTLYYLDKYLPQKGLILDAGGGPGRYTLELAKKGYDVVLLDATQANLDFAKRQIKRHGLQSMVKEITAGSIVDLSKFGEATFEAVLCIGGPLSHILEPHDRELAISELVRVVKPGAPIFVSVIGRLAVLVVILMEESDEIEMPHFQQILQTGDYLGGHGFTACHFYLPEELREEFTREDVHILELVGLEGLSVSHIRELNRLAKNEIRYRIWLDAHYQTCTHPAVVATSEHMLIVCRKSPSESNQQA
jgi:2-polyprenyl-3-methyl-5-hydroxy-6-metoxy-1,4-benzoquinol methylase